MFKLSQLHSWLGANSINLKGDACCQGICIDSRLDVKGKLFVAFVGNKVDANKFIDDALAKGAVAILSNTEINATPSLQVSNIMDAINCIAKNVRANFLGAVVAITGSSGKTSTKNACSTLLKDGDNNSNDINTDTVLATLGNHNNEIGVPMTLSFLDKQKYAVIELGAGKPNDIAPIAQLAKPKISMIVNVDTAHLQAFGNTDAIAQEKGNIIDATDIAGTVILNADDSYFSYFCKRAVNRKILSVGYAKNADIKINSVQDCAYSGSKFCLEYDNKNYSMQLHLLGKCYIYSAAFAFAMAIALELDLDKIATKIATIKTEPRRMQLIKTSKYTLIDDSYNANPLSMKTSLQFLLQLANANPNTNIIAVLGDMLELGEVEIKLHQEIGKWLADKNTSSIHIWAVGKLAVSLAKASNLPYVLFTDTADLINKFADIKNTLTKDNYTFFFKASNGVGLNKFIQLIKSN